MIVLAQQICRTGHQQLLTDGARFFMQIDNRTYHSRVEVPASRAHLWYAALNA